MDVLDGLSRTRRVFGDALVSAGVVAMVLAVLVSLDVRVREQVYAAMTSASGISGSGQGTWREVGSALVDSVMTQSREHAPMMIFAVVGVILLLCMVRA